MTSTAHTLSNVSHFVTHTHTWVWCNVARCVFATHSYTCNILRSVFACLSDWLFVSCLSLSLPPCWGRCLCLCLHFVQMWGFACGFMVLFRRDQHLAQFSDIGHAMLTMFTYALGGVELDVMLGSSNPEVG